MDQHPGDLPSSLQPSRDGPHQPAAAAPSAQPSQSESSRTAHSASSPHLAQHESSQLASSAATASPTAPPFQPYQPYSFAYHADQGTSQYSQPVVFLGPRPDSDPYSDDDDSAIGDYDSTKSLSLDSKSYEFRHEFSRRYHAKGEGAEYHLPNDETELDRLDLQHQMFLITLDGALHRSPLAKDIHHVLDVGTGTGIWAIDFADKYPSAIVTGTDLSPIQPDYVPPNCRFYVENAEEEWSFDSPFDFIHTRMLVIAIRNWAGFFEQAFASLKPGGYIELQDLNFPARCDDDTAPPDSPIMVWSGHMMEAAQRIGLDLSISSTFPALLNAAGFVDVKYETYSWPINKWPKEKKMKRLGTWAYQNFMQGLHGFSMGFFTRVLAWKEDDVMELVGKAGEQARDLNSHVYMPISFFWAKKPE